MMMSPSSSSTSTSSGTHLSASASAMKRLHLPKYRNSGASSMSSTGTTSTCFGSIARGSADSGGVSGCGGMPSGGDGGARITEMTRVMRPRLRYDAVSDDSSSPTQSCGTISSITGAKVRETNFSP